MSFSADEFSKNIFSSNTGIKNSRHISQTTLTMLMPTLFNIEMAKSHEVMIKIHISIMNIFIHFYVERLM